MKGKQLQKMMSLCVLFLLVGGVNTVWGLPVALESSIPLVLADGTGMATGMVREGHEIWSFKALAGDLLTLDVEVTEILPGLIFTNNDTVLFLFDSMGRLIAENDDFGDSLESAIVNFLLPGDDMYYVGVTTGFNKPSMVDGIIEDWRDTGLSHVAYNLHADIESAPVPEPATMFLFGTGLACFAGMRKRGRR